MDEDRTPGAWWHKPLVGAGGLVLGSILSFVQSHWNGVSQDDLSKGLAATTVTLENKIDGVAAACSDKMKVYADAAIAEHEKRTASPPPKKRKVARDQ